MSDAAPVAVASPVIDQLRNTARQAHTAAKQDLAAARAQRDGLNAQIAGLVLTEADLRRAVNALTRTPRTRKPAVKGKAS